MSMTQTAQMLRLVKTVTACAVLTLALPAAVHASDAAPTPAEIAKARGECAMHKQKVHALEASNADDAQLSAARLDWEHACGHAQDLMNAAAGKQPPEPHPDPNAANAAAAPAQ